MSASSRREDITLPPGELIERELNYFLKTYDTNSKEAPPVLLFPWNLGPIIMKSIRYQAALHDLGAVYIQDGNLKVVAVCRKQFLREFCEDDFEGEDTEPLDVENLKAALQGPSWKNEVSEADKPAASSIKKSDKATEKSSLTSSQPLQTTKTTLELSDIAPAPPSRNKKNGSKQSAENKTLNDANKQARVTENQQNVSLKQPIDNKTLSVIINKQQTPKKQQIASSEKSIADKSSASQNKENMSPDQHVDNEVCKSADEHRSTSNSQQSVASEQCIRTTVTNQTPISQQSDNKSSRNVNEQGQMSNKEKTASSKQRVDNESSNSANEERSVTTKPQNIDKHSNKESRSSSNLQTTSAKEHIDNKDTSNTAGQHQASKKQNINLQQGMDIISVYGEEKLATAATTESESPVDESKTKSASELATLPPKASATNDKIDSSEGKFNQPPAVQPISEKGSSQQYRSQSTERGKYRTRSTQFNRPPAVQPISEKGSSQRYISQTTEQGKCRTQSTQTQAGGKRRRYLPKRYREQDNQPGDSDSTTPENERRARSGRTINTDKESEQPLNKKDIEEKLAHVIELYDFPETFSTNTFLNIFREPPRYVKWCDDQHVLLVTGSAQQAKRTLNVRRKMVKARPLTEASPMAIKIAARFMPAGEVKTMTWISQKSKRKSQNSEN